VASDPDIEVIGWHIGRLKSLPTPSRVRDCTGPTRESVDRMFDVCQRRHDPKGRRDEAILCLLYLHALRAMEVLSLRLRDVDVGGRMVRVIAKRGQGRMAMRLCGQAWTAVCAWMEARGREPGPLFTRCRCRGNAMDPQPLSYWGLRGMIRRLGMTVGIPCWPHALRHAAVTHLAMFTSDSPVWGCALSRHRTVTEWARYQDRKVSHVSAAEVLSAGRQVRQNPSSAENQC
jgi:integrase